VMGTPAAAATGEIFGIETEGLSGADQEFEVMRRFVRFAGAAAGRAARAPRGVNPRAIARSALVRAARRLAPGILRRWASRLRGPESDRRRRPGWHGVGHPQGSSAPGYGYPPYQPQPGGAPGTPAPQQAPPGFDPNAASAGFGGASDPNAAAMSQGMQDSSAGPDSATGPPGPLPQTGRWTRQGGQLIIHL
jgi:hypothetical protein